MLRKGHSANPPGADWRYTAVKIAIVSQWFPPEKAFIPADVARGLVASGHEVTVITGFPNYPLGKIYAGWRQRPWRDQVSEGYRVRRVALYPSHSASALHRAAGYLSFAATSAVFAWRILRQADVVYVYHPPLTAAFGPWLSRSLRGAPYVLHVQDIWPDSVLSAGLVRPGTASLLRFALEAACRLIYRQANALVAIAPTMSALLAERSYSRDRLHVVPNWADEDVFQPIVRNDAAAEQLNPSGSFIVMFAGNMGDIQALDVAIHAAARLADIEQFRLVLVGEGVARPALEKLVNDLAATNVTFRPAQPLDRMNEVTHAADVQLVCLRDLPFLRGTVPSKLGAVMAAGLPVICAVGGDANRMVEVAGAGWTCQPEDVDDLAAAFRSAYNARTELARRGSAARRYYEEHLGRSHGVSALSSILTSQASGHR